jgi:molybdate transport system substrate-binding protein
MWTTPLIALVLLALAALQTAAAGDAPTVSAAVSLREVLTESTGAARTATGDSPQFNFGATGHLLAQIRDGAPVDVFVAASDEQMDQAEAQNLVDRSTRTVVAGNELVLIVPKTAAGDGVTSFADLNKPAVKRLAVGQPKTVPAGAYGTQVLEHLKLTSALADRLVYGSSVRQVLDYVARGEVDAGIVYATDAREAGDAVRVIATADPAWHAPIRYVAAVVARSKNPGSARRFVEFLRSDAAQKLFRDLGFTSSPSNPATRPISPR